MLNELPRIQRNFVVYCVCFILVFALTFHGGGRRGKPFVEVANSQHRIVASSSRQAVSQGPGTTRCGMKFVKYEPSALEESWHSAISELKSNTASWEGGCNKVRQEHEAHEEIIRSVEQHATHGIKHPSTRSLSYFVYKDTCTGLIAEVPIEPLTSFLRHPLALCPVGAKEDLILDKTYLLIPFTHEVHGAETSYKWLFDAGASTYDTGAGGASQSWFVDTYRDRGFEFDRIIGWEAAPTDPRRQWDAVPADIKRKTSWYNIPATIGVGDADNPLTFIKELTKQEDYVVFKLDIDAPAIEIPLVQQLLSDPELLSLIDEFYFEHHVTNSPMQWKGWGDLTDDKSPLGDIQDSYNLFASLRERGVRAHSWV